MLNLIELRNQKLRVGVKTLQTITKSPRNSWITSRYFFTLVQNNVVLRLKDVSIIRKKVEHFFIY